MSENITDSFITLASEAENEIKIKASRFIGMGFPISDVAEAKTILADIRKKHYTANHHCYAYTAGIENEQFKYSDDGEPNGTAGIPIYRVITGRNIKNILAVVVRYFGGTKLGTGGLTRAYSQATMDMLEQASLVERLICDRLSFSLPFSLYDRLMRIINTDKFEIINQEFADDVSVVLEIRKSKTNKFIEQMTELTGGKIIIEKES
ncbi:MAG: YigZ family protein [candidate division Zixibacteria bacterium]|nr:YigZ family protein [candidate division Zixibacteria bacterium]